MIRKSNPYAAEIKVFMVIINASDRSLYFDEDAQNHLDDISS